MLVGTYEVIGRVATGSSGTVWKGRDPDLDRLVALKQFPHPSEADRAELSAEAETLAALQHPHIVAVYDVVTDLDAMWLVQEWIDGASFAAVVTGSHGLTTQQCLGVLRGALSGLAYAHQRGIVHGDVSPSNILVDTTGTSKLIDFGLGGRLGRTAHGGTPGFASPEALQGSVLSTASDVYSAAAVLAVALGPSRSASAAPAALDLSGLPAEVRSVLATASAPAPADRYPDAQALLDALNEAAERTWGAGWWTTAAVGTAAAAAAPAVVAVTTAAGAGAVATPAVVGVAASTGSLSATVTKQVLKPRLGQLKGLIAIGAAVVVVAGGVAAAALVDRSGASQAAPDSGAPVPTERATSAPPSAEPTTVDPPASTPKPTPTPTPTPEDGVFTVVKTVTKSNRPAYPVGQKEKDSWTLDVVCDPDCAVSEPGEGTKVKGNTWSYSYTVKTTCTRTNDAGKKYDKSEGSLKAKVVLTFSEATKGKPQSFTGTIRERLKKECPGYEGDFEPWSIDYKLKGTFAGIEK